MKKSSMYDRFGSFICRPRNAKPTKSTNCNAMVGAIIAVASAPKYKDSFDAEVLRHIDKRTMPESRTGSQTATKCRTLEAYAEHQAK